MRYLFILYFISVTYGAYAQEKKNLNKHESSLLKTIVSSNDTITKWDNRDSLKICKESYIFLKSPIDILDGAQDLLYSSKQGFSPGLSFRKRYIVNFEIIDSLLYITNYHLAPDYIPLKNNDIDITKALRQFLGKKINKGEKFKVDWLKDEHCHERIITLYVADSSDMVYSLDFKQGKLIRKRTRKNISVKEQNLPKIEDLKVKE